MKACGGAESAAPTIPGVSWLRSATRKRREKETILLPIGIGRVLAFATDEHKLDRHQQLLQVDRLPDNFLRAHCPGFIEALFVVAPGDDDHPSSVFTLTKLPEPADPRHPWHDQIEKNKTGGREFHYRESLGSVFHSERPIASESEKLYEQ